jgi:hypothetical protein
MLELLCHEPVWKIEPYQVLRPARAGKAGPISIFIRAVYSLLNKTEPVKYQANSVFRTSPKITA